MNENHLHSAAERWRIEGLSGRTREGGSGQILQTESEHAWVTSCVSLYICEGERKRWKEPR